MSFQSKRRDIALSLKNSFTINTWFNYGVSLFGFTIVTLLVVGKLPVEEITVWLLFNSLMNFSNLVDFGFSPVISRQYSYCVISIGSNEDQDYKWAKIAKIYGLSGIIFLSLLVLFVLVGFLLYKTSISHNIIKTVKVSELSLAYLILIAGLSISFYGKKYSNALMGLGKVPLVNRINAILNLGKYIIGGIAFYLFESILILVIVYQIVNVSIVVKNYFLLRSEFRQFKGFKNVSFNRETFDEIFSPAWRGAIGLLGSTGVVEISGHLFSIYGNNNEVANYLFAIRIIGYVSMISSIPFYSKLPIWNSLRKNGEIIRLINESFRSLNIVCGVYLIGVVSALFIIPFILKIIGSDLSFVTNELWLFIALVYFLERHHGVHAHLYATTNKEPFYKPIIISGLIYLGTLFFVRESLTAWNIVLCYFFTNLLINNWWNVFISIKSLGLSVNEYIAKVKPAIFFFLILTLLWGYFFI